ncbi:MAG: hypothetical protein G8345_03020 [Magnetococcales bacterium]|nr:hypothetical protein [Magnetococcales bacterium]
MNIDLATVAPVWLAQSHSLQDSLQDILVAVNQVENWTENMAQALDDAYRYRVARLLADQGSNEEITEMIYHLNEVAHHPRREPVLDAMELPYASRWRAYRDILEDRIALRETAIPDAVKNRRYAKEILQFVNRLERVPQKEVLDYFEDQGLKKANLTRILTVLVGWELLHRQRVGRENYLATGPRIEEVLPNLRQEKPPLVGSKKDSQISGIVERLLNEATNKPVEEAA